MINRFQVQNYKALCDVTLELTPMHVLIGPNDSGKTSLLEAMTALSRSVDHPLSASFTGSWNGPQLVWNRRQDLPISLTADISSDEGNFEYHYAIRFPASGRAPRIESEQVRFNTDIEPIEFTLRQVEQSNVFQITSGNAGATAGQRRAADLVLNSLRGVHYYHWDPHALALPVASDSKRRFRMESTGFGLAQCLDDILGDDRDRFTALENRFKAIFPQVQSIKLKSEPAYHSSADQSEFVPMLSRAEGKGIYFQFQGSTEPVSASQVSDGLMLVLAYLTVLHLPEPPRLVLVEEPENGIHPARLRDVLKILRELVQEQSHSQVVITTHSPYVVDLFSPEEVTLCRKKDDVEISVMCLSESQKVRDQLDVFTLGEIWSAEGDDALVHPDSTVKEATP
ncbi:MAG: hypothetical protein EXS05_10150 [Planctomycetaceae bacterium]|nr:hypothetical protein [Planctomycetaceae bacterium]